MIIYIHGFGGSGEGSKAKAFRDYFNSIGETFLAPSLSFVPELAIKTLEELIDSYKGEVYLIGSSLGGYYTSYLAQHRYVKKVVLLNPSVNPTATLSSAVGDAPNFYDNSSFKWETKHLDMLKSYEVHDLERDKFMLLVQKGDELLDYKEAVEKYDGCKMLVEEGGSHGFDEIEKHFESIRKFFSVGNYFKHTMKPKDVGFSNKELAIRIGDLYYDALGDLLTDLANKLNEDAKADEKRGRKRLADNLQHAATSINNASMYIERAWGNCEVHTLEWLDKNGNNRDK